MNDKLGTMTEALHHVSHAIEEQKHAERNQTSDPSEANAALEQARDQINEVLEQ